ncbi:MAG: 2-C-methyl-D-erythritol 4-phosphate cytidylyltransferase [Candidatus Sungbacteria bacterium]|nr:2-C-methyl-D-erythritol 4-phosphate cytidylyltransferase [Candidatus Sungbacteria bacterium]
MKKKNIDAILLAAGKGERAGGNYKQFVHVHQKPLIFYSLEKIVRISCLRNIIVVVPLQKINFAKKIIYERFKDPRIHIIPGGATRRISSYIALSCSEKKGNTDFIVFHEAARPLITTTMVYSVIKEAMRCGAAITGIPAIDTVAKVKDMFITSIPDRKKMFYVYLPQCFRFSWIIKAHRDKKNKILELENAENTELLVNMGKRIKIVNFYPNFKFTYSPDIKVISAFFKK